MHETLFVLANDDPGITDPQGFETFLDFLSGQSVATTFFVVPAYHGGQLSESPEWIHLLHRALDEGHDLQLHGFTHSRFEFGFWPEKAWMDMVAAAESAGGVDSWERQVRAIEAGHNLEILTDKVARGMAIFQRVLGCEPMGFRAPYLGTSDNMYRALASQGICWSSSQIVNPHPTARWYFDRLSDGRGPWRENVSPHPYRHDSGLIEVPLISEYTWQLTAEESDDAFALAKDDLDRICQAGGAFVTMSHYHAMTGEWSAGLDVCERLFDYARQRGDVRFCTITELVQRWDEGEAVRCRGRRVCAQARSLSGGSKQVAAVSPDVRQHGVCMAGSVRDRDEYS